MKSTHEAATVPISGWIRRTSRGGNQRAYRRYVSGFVEDEDDVLSETLKASRYAIDDERFRERTEESVLGVRLNKAVAGHFGYGSESAIGKQRCKLAGQMERDAWLASLFRRLAKKASQCF